MRVEEIKGESRRGGEEGRGDQIYDYFSPAA